MARAKEPTCFLKTKKVKYGWAIIEIHSKYKIRFWDQFHGRSVKVYDENGKNGIDVFLIGKIKSRELAGDIARFVKEVAKLKKDIKLKPGRAKKR